MSELLSEDKTVLITEDSSLTTTPKIDLPEIVRRYANGESLSVLAKENSVHRNTIYNWIFSDISGEEHQSLVTQCLINRIAQSDEEMDLSVTALDVSRAREKMRFARMDFERRRPKLYGPQSAQAVDNRVMVVIER